MDCGEKLDRSQLQAKAVMWGDKHCTLAPVGDLTAGFLSINDGQSGEVVELFLRGTGK